MASVSSLGVGSGMDLQGLLTKLVSAEQAPLTQLNTKEATIQTSISAVGSLKGALASLQTTVSNLTPATNQSAATKFSSYQTSIADSSIASVSAGSTAVSGTYSLEVLSLAQAQQQVLKPTYGAGAFALDFGGKDSATVTLTKGSGESVSLTLNSSQNTLADLRDAINKSNGGVSAVIINGADGKQNLMVSATGTGIKNAVTLSGTLALTDPQGGPAISLATAFQNSQPAKDASATVNGIPVAATGNTLDTAIDGLTLTLMKTTVDATSGVSTPTTITVTKDNSMLKSGVNALVKGYNDFMSTAVSLGGYNSATKVAGPLNGDSMLRSSQSQIRSLFTSVPAELKDAPYKNLSDIGVTVDRNGIMSVDSTKLANAMSKNADGVAQLVAAYSGNVKNTTTRLLDSSGAISSKIEGLNRKVSQLDKQRDAISRRVMNIQKMYQAQFTALDRTVSSMQSTSSYLSQQLSLIANTK